MFRQSPDRNACICLCTCWHVTAHTKANKQDKSAQDESESWLSHGLQGLRKVWAPKVTSAQLWSQVTHSQGMTTQVLFSSVAALLGSAGQANYSAANGALDGLAAQWAAQGRAGVSSIQWGGWAGGGMANADASTAARLARMGMPLITPSLLPWGMYCVASVHKLASAAWQLSLSCGPHS